MSGHTPGPWTWSGDTLYGTTTYDNGAAHQDAPVLEIECDGGWDGCTVEVTMSEADKALIASAPTLLQENERLHLALNATRKALGEALEALTAARSSR